MQAAISETATRIITELGYRPNQVEAFVELLKLTEALPENFQETQDPIELLTSLKDATQAKWFKSEERWELKDTEEQQAQRNTFFRLFDDLKLLKPTTPRDIGDLTEFDDVLILGALESRVRTRTAYLKHLWEDCGVRWKHVYLLGGKRPLMDEKENRKAVGHFCNKAEEETTELDMMRWVYTETSKHWLKEMQVQPLLVDSPMKRILQVDGTFKECRPNTNDNFKHYSNIAKAGSRKILVISNQPYNDYQHAVAKTNLDTARFSISTVGHKCSDSEKVATILGSLARIVYQNYPSLKKKFEQEKELTSTAKSEFTL